MGELGGFLKIERVGFRKRDPRERVRDYRQYFSLPDDQTLREQGGRCMDCGVPFCQEGCPLGNKIPDWNDLVYADQWREALTQLHATNNFPEFTGLNRHGHEVVVYERDEGPGGMLRFGVPDAKLEKWIIDRRVALLEEEGISFEYGVDVGRSVSVAELRERHDAVVVAIGSRAHPPPDGPRPHAGGGGAAGGLFPAFSPPLPADGRPAGTPWPLPPKRTHTTYALDEGGDRRFGTQVTAILGEDGRVAAVEGRRVEGTSSRDLRAVPGSDFTEPADLVLIAIGFSHPEHEGAVEGLGVDLDARGNLKAPVYATSEPGVFACGDARIGQSLVVTAIAEGRRCARVVDRFLGGPGETRRVTASALFAFEDGDPHSLRHQAETARTVTVGDAFWSGPREES